MTPAQREAAARLADELQRFDGAERESLRDEAAALLRELAAVPKSAIERFNETEGVDAMSPLERLRFFCSLSMTPQDWLDVEPFFDALAAEPQGEPVAWKFSRRYGSGLSFTKPTQTKDEDEEFQPPVPLYTHPPQQRKPLTDDQIIDIGNEEHRAMPAGSDEQDELLAIARAVERAHGIGEAP